MAKIEGLEQALSALSSLGGNVRVSTKKGLQRAAKKIQKQAKLNCPVGETGELRNSIHTSSEETEDGAIARVYTNKEYAVYVEFGTGQRGASSNIERPEGISYKANYNGQAAHPYMTPAYLHAKNSGEIEEEIIKSVQEDIKRMESDSKK